MDADGDGCKSDPLTRPEPEPEPGVQESTWQMDLDGEPYPERPGEPDCIYFLRTGSCGYGDRCRFNHPRHRSQVSGGRRFSGGDRPDPAGQPFCQYFVKTGTCKFGTSCKYHHPKQGAVSVSPFTLNIYGYPLRSGEKECAYYIRTGQCKFGMICKFHHPQPINVQVPTATSSAMPPSPVAVYSPVQFPSSPSPGPQQYGMVTGNWPIVRPQMMPGSYVQGPYGPFYLPSGMVPLSGWGPYSVPNSLTMPTNPSAVEAGQLYGMTQLAVSATSYAGTFPAIPTSAGPSSGILKDQSFPLRPGQPQCQYYLKTGDCKFGMSCKYHHPTEWVVHEISPALSPMGLPLRPDTPVCSFYAQHGVCKFGPTCKFDHPMGTLSYTSSASSLSDMPVAPYPVGTSMGTLAPSSSSSSSDLPTEGVMSGSNKCPSPILATSISISSGSGGSLSKNGSISNPGVQRTHQTPSTSSTGSADHEGAPS